MSEKNQYLLFLTGGVLYAVEALRVKEIVEYSAITKIPMMNKYIKGVTNIRGDIVPVVDLLNRFKLGDTSITDKTSVVVINYKKDDTNTINIGMIIDEIYEVDEINIQDIKKAPEFGSKIDMKYIQSMGKYEGEYIAILNTDTILDIAEISQLRKGSDI